MRRTIHLIGLFTLGLPVWAGEYVVLANGFRLHADRHEAQGESIRLFSGDGFTDMEAAKVNSFEPDGEPPKSPAPAPAVAVKLVAAAPMKQPAELAVEAARKFSLPESFVRSVMKAESGFQPGALSPKGAIGLMQLMQDTARKLGVNPRDPKQNAEGGAQYLRELLTLYENKPDQVMLALAAYNAGPGAVEKYHGVPPYRETRQYILRVLREWNQTAVP